MKLSNLFIASLLPAAASVFWLACSSDPVDTTDGGTDAAIDSTPATETGPTETGTDGAVGPTCAEFCDLAVANCKAGSLDVDAGENGRLQYTDKQGCLNACAPYAKGTVDDKASNTVGCRIYHAGVAVGDPRLHCPHTSISGGDVCTDPAVGDVPGRCVSFCKSAIALCGVPGTDAGTGFANEAACQSQCKGWFFPANGSYVFDTTGNTFNCRHYHLMAAYANPPASATLHCPHIANISDVCASPK